MEIRQILYGIQLRQQMALCHNINNIIVRTPILNDVIFVTLRVGCRAYTDRLPWDLWGHARDIHHGSLQVSSCQPGASSQPCQIKIATTITEINKLRNETSKGETDGCRALLIVT